MNWDRPDKNPEHIDPFSGTKVLVYLVAFLTTKNRADYGRKTKTYESDKTIITLT